MLKILFVVLDGAADRSIKELGNRTPLESARTPNMDYITARSKRGILSVAKKIAPESDEAVLSLLGYEPKKYYVHGAGRGAIEAAGAGMDFEEGDLAIRCNFASVDKNGMLLDSRSDLETHETEGLCRFLEKRLRNKLGFKFELKAFLGYRAGLVIKAARKPLSEKITNTHPGYTRKMFDGAMLSSATQYVHPIVKKCEPLEKSDAARFSANLVNEFIEAAAKLLAAHPFNVHRKQIGKNPVNFILSRDASTSLPNIPPIKNKTSASWAILADMATEIGIGKISGMKIVKLPASTGHGIKDYPVRAAAALKSLKKFDAVYVHLKGPDIFAHEGKAREKRRSIESIDQHFFGPLLKKLDLAKTVVCITCDHATPCALKVHSADPVPVAIYTPHEKGDGLRFTEKLETHWLSKIPRRGSLGKMDAAHLLLYLMRAAR